MKTFRQLLWFIIPTAVIAILFPASLILSFHSFSDILHPSGFVGYGNYLNLLFHDDVFLKALFNTIAWPAVITFCVGIGLLLLKHFLFREKYTRIFYGATFALAALTFHFTANLKMLMGLPLTAYSARAVVSAGSVLAQPSVPAILISLQVGIIVCFLCWCADKILGKLLCFSMQV